MQWFLFAAIALVIYGLALRKRLRQADPTPMMRLTTLPNGLRVASRAMPGVETAAVGLYAEAGSRYEPARLNGIAHLFEHMVFKGAGGRSAREISEAIEDVGGDLNACDRARRDQLHRLGAGRALPLGGRADRRPGPAARISTRAELEREKDVVLQELGEARDTPSDIIFDDLWTRRLRRPAARPLDPRRRGEHRRDHASTISTTGGARSIAPAA